MSYGSILEMGGTFFPDSFETAPIGSDNFLWLFRTGFWNYDRQAISITRWVEKLFAWTVDLRFREAHNWDGGFNAYDDVAQGMTDVIGSKDYKSWNEFFEFLPVFRADLTAAAQDFQREEELTVKMVQK